MQEFLKKVTALDYELFKLINGLAGTSILDTPLVILASDYLVPITLASLLVFLWFHGKTNDERVPNQITVFKSLICMGCASLFVLIINTFLFRDRPFTTHEVNLLFYMPTDSSFPANSLASGLGISLPVIGTHKITGYSMLAACIVMGTARVYVGVHYPGDLIFAAAVALGAFIVCNPLTTILQYYYLKAIDVLRKIYLA